MSDLDAEPSEETVTHLPHWQTAHEAAARIEALERRLGFEREFVDELDDAYVRVVAEREHWKELFHRKVSDGAALRAELEAEASLADRLAGAGEGGNWLGYLDALNEYRSRRAADESWRP